jgi:hypothetical protein
MGSHGHAHPLTDSRLQPSAKVKTTIFVLVAIGLIAAALGFGSDSTRTWGSLLYNFFFFYSVAVLGLAFAGIQEVVRARWARPVKRLHEMFGSFVMVGSVFFILLLGCLYTGFGGADKMYSWMMDSHLLDHFAGKRDWLKKDLLVYRDVFAVVCIAAGAWWQLRCVVSRDQKYLAGESGAKEYGLKTRDHLRYWSAPILVLYALCFSLLGFDLLMSLEPLWFSTLWGGWLFALAMQTMLASLSLWMFWLKSSEIGKQYSTQQFHDIGKLLYGFSIFFAYLTYAHILTYWYGNVPEETEYFFHRLTQPWLSIVLITPLFNFVLPLFGLIPKASKYTPIYTPIVCICIILAQWFVMMLVVMPAVYDAHNQLYFPWIELGVGLGVLGLFLASIFRFGSKYPVVAAGDPDLRMYEAAH